MMDVIMEEASPRWRSEGFISHTQLQSASSDTNPDNGPHGDKLTFPQKKTHLVAAWSDATTHSYSVKVCEQKKKKLKKKGK